MSEILPEMSPLSVRKMITSYKRLADDLELYVDFGIASVEVETTISGWAVARRTVPALSGTMQRHPTIKDGNVGISTRLLLWNLEQRLARSHNRWYRLVDPVTPIPGTRQ
ncbi:hypothetical protein [uncultured Rhizobium sp.]|uniref:hypothetical protein n=1 Tax=unclassified Neorhizobium TaxID=2629175 RepID=UPI002D7EDDC4|nr:hypothetical protein [uncultured Rhizobium sp.]